MPGNSPSRKSNNQKPKSKSKEESMNSKITKSRQKSSDENLYDRKSSDQKQLKNVKIAVAVSNSKIPESSPTTNNASPVLKNESKKASKMGKTKSKEYSGSFKKFKELQKKNNEREDQLLRRLNALFDDDCNVSGLKQAVALEHHLLKRLDYGLNDHMNLFKGNLTKSIEYLSVIQQYRRMQAHKMAILLDRIDEECKKTNQLLEEHFQDINCVYQLMKPDATPKELMLYIYL
uniref:Uncharacterized protein n=1 Tax=Panagrolaimus davidi TaxID=227884 RepID=A0A914NZ78_9BILA